MHPLKNIHHHIKKHHKKYLLGTAIGGFGFFAVKAIIFIGGMLSMFPYTQIFADDITPPVLTRTGDTPADNAWIAANSFTAQLDIVEDNLNQFKRTRNGTDYSVYDSGLVLMMNFDKVSALSETDGLIKDFSWYGNNGSGYGGVTWTASGKWNGAYQFDGSNDYITLPDNILINASTWTIAIWLNTSSSSDNRSPIGGSLGFVNHLPTVRFKSGKYQFYASDNSASTYFVNGVQTSSSIAIGRWEHLVYLYNGSNLLVYRYGILTDTLAATANKTLPSNSTTNRIGECQLGGSAGCFSGSIDEPRIYNRALTSGEVRELYYSNLNKYDTNKWNFTILETGLVANTMYGYTGYANDLSGNITSIGRTINKDFILLSPSNSAVITTGSANLLRSPSSWPVWAGYTYQVSTDSGFTSFFASGTTTATGITLTGYADGTYYRRVAAYDNNSNTGGRSDVSMFYARLCGGRDNSQFLTQDFRDSSPSNDKVVCALFGDGTAGINRTAYTSGRNSVACATGSMIVTGRTAGADQLPVNLVDNTIYVLESGAYTTTATRNMGTCNAIVGKGTVTIKANYVTNTRLLNSATKSKVILDNLKLDRNRGANTGTSTDVVYFSATPSTTLNNVKAYNGYVGIYLSGSTYGTINNSQTYSNASRGMMYYNGSNYGTINNSQSYNNATYGMIFSTSSNYGTINNSQSYNNLLVGISFHTSSNTGTINNSQTYNNSGYGIIFTTSANYGTINNSQSYNNTGIGIFFHSASNYDTVNNSQSYNNTLYGIHFLTSINGAINNTQVYNNGSYGIYFLTTATNGTINNSQVYNNAGIGIYYNASTAGRVNNTWSYNNVGNGINFAATSTTAKYYGDNKFFSNTSAGIGGTTANFTTGTDGLVGWNNGTIDLTPVVTRDYLTNPKNTSANYLLSRSGTFASLQGRNTVFAFTSGMQYSYGSGILTQTQPVDYVGTSLVAGGTYTGTSYIGGDVSQMGGDLEGIDMYSTINSTVTGTSTSPISKYNVYGNITSFISGADINTATGIELTAGGGPNYIITQFYNPLSYFAMHFQKLTMTATDTTPPSTPTLSSPATASSSSSSSRTFVWTVAADTGVGMGGYIYQISSDAGFATILMSGTTPWTTTTVSLTGIADGTYYRRVAGYDLASNTGSRSSSRNFIVDTTSPVLTRTGATPVDNAWINTNSFTAQLDIREPNLNQFIWTWNGTEYLLGLNKLSLFYSGVNTDDTITASVDSNGIMKLYPDASLGLAMTFDNEPLFGDTGTTIADLSRYNNTGTIYGGAVWTGAGKYGGAYYFDGINNYINIADSASVDPTTARTLSAWIKRGAVGVSHPILEKYNYAAEKGNYALRILATNKLIAYGTNGALIQDCGTTTTTIGAGTRYYVTATFDSTTNRLVCYVNGIAEATNAAATYNPPDSSLPLRIGARGNDLVDRFKGIIDEPRIYSRALTSGEIRQLYSYNLNKYTTNKWNFTILQTGGVGGNGMYGYTGYASDIMGHDPTSTGRTIGYTDLPPSITTLSSPLSGSVSSGTATTLTRNIPAYVGRGISGYLYQVSTDSRFASITFSGASPTTGISLTGFADGLYYRRVAAYDVSGAVGGRSDMWNFRIDATLPVLIRTGATPVDNAWIATNSFTAQLDIVEDNLSQFKRTRNGTDYNIYDSGLVTMYNFDKVVSLGESDAMIKDFSSYGNNGSGYGGVTWTGGGKWNGGYTFNGTNGYIDIGIGSSLYSTQRTTSIWIKPTSVVGYHAIIGESYDATHGIVYLHGNKLSVWTTADHDSITSILPNVWTHIAVVVDSVGMKYYINGTLDSSSWAIKPLLKGVGAGTVKIGRHPITSIEFFAGTIDEVRVYKRALSADEISALYNSNLNKYDTNKWNFTVLQDGLVANGTYGYTGYASDSLGNPSASTGRTIGRDAVGPNFTFADNSGSECSAGTLSISSASDTGAGLHTTPYSFDGATWNTSTNLTITAQQPGTQTKTGRVRDQFLTTTTHTATYTFTDVAPTANDFTGSADVGNTPHTGNRKTLSSASEGSCGNGDLVYDSIVSQGTKGSCSVVGNIVTYTPNAGQIGSDSCTIAIKDNENSTANMIVSRGNIDTMAPTATISYSITGATDQNVTATITLSEPGTITNNGGSDTYLFTGNGSFLFTFQDSLGNTGDATARVNRINFTFTSLSGVLYNTLYTSNIVTIQGFGPGIITGVSITTGTLYKNGIALAGLTATGEDGDQFYIGLVSASVPLTTGSSTMQIGLAAGTYSITTLELTFAIEGPAGLDLGSIPTPETTQIIEKTFTGASDYFVVSDYIGDDVGYYTTVSMGNMTDGNGDVLSNSNIAIKTATNIITLSGSANPNVTSAITGSYIPFGNSVLTFIKRDPGSNGGLKGSYGVSPGLQVTVPELQGMGNYSGTLIYTFYPN